MVAAWRAVRWESRAFYVEQAGLGTLWHRRRLRRRRLRCLRSMCFGYCMLCLSFRLVFMHLLCR